MTDNVIPGAGPLRHPWSAMPQGEGARTACLWFLPEFNQSGQLSSFCEHRPISEDFTWLPDGSYLRKLFRIDGYRRTIEANDYMQSKWKLNHAGGS